jgi:ABC-2 type transport system ATP-binding protein
MLKLLARILVPDRGRVATRGRISALLELGAGFHPELTGRENVFLNGSILGMSTATLRSKFDEIVEFSGLESFIDQPIKTYSSGMHARLGFSVAVAVEPDVLLIDEVLAVGDEQFQRRCAEKMTEIRTSGRTVVIVSHSLGQVQQLCDHAAWLDKGTVRAVGGTEDVVADYLGSITTAYRLDAKGRQRTGSGEIELEVELIGLTDDANIPTGAPITIRFHWRSEQTVQNVGFWFTMRAADGYVIAGSSNAAERLPTCIGPGSGYVDYRIPEFSLLPGSYHVAAAIMDRTDQHVYDHSPNIVEFDVAGTSAHAASVGVVELHGLWTEVSSSR